MELDLAQILGVTALVAGHFAGPGCDIAASSPTSSRPADRRFDRAVARAAGESGPEASRLSRRREAPAPPAPAG